MPLESIVREHLSKLPEILSEGGGANETVDKFVKAWRELGRELLERQLQEQIEEYEASLRGCRQRREREYQTPLGPIKLTRRAYGSKGAECRADKGLKLPEDGWFTQVKEMACALGVGSEFANANRLLERWSGVTFCEKTLSNHVKGYGAEMAEAEALQPVEGVCPVVSSVSQAAMVQPERPVFYIGADGIHTPLRQGATREAKVGVMFWDADHLRLCPTRSTIRQREYVATLEAADGFRDQLNRCYAQTVQQQPHQVVFLGDGAAWLWVMTSLLFPDCIEILDFFHVSEYIWDVARTGFPDPETQRNWVETQQALLKQSQWQDVVQAAVRLPPGSSDLQENVDSLVSYLTNNQTRIDYRSYLQRGLMIGSGVVESSNRRIVTVRLKQSGMFWSMAGAEAVMTLRACYLSSSQRWHDFWYKSPAIL
jgi:hypothetical protein